MSIQSSHTYHPLGRHSSRSYDSQFETAVCQVWTIENTQRAIGEPVHSRHMWPRSAWEWGQLPIAQGCLWDSSFPLEQGFRALREDWWHRLVVSSLKLPLYQQTAIISSERSIAEHRRAENSNPRCFQRLLVGWIHRDSSQWRRQQQWKKDQPVAVVEIISWCWGHGVHGASLLLEFLSFSESFDSFLDSSWCCSKVVHWSIV